MSRRAFVASALAAAGCARGPEAAPPTAAAVPEPAVLDAPQPVPDATPIPVQARRAAPAPSGDPLAPFHAALNDLQRGRRRQPVLVVQFGDSHTAGPFMVPRLREVLQARYGAVGPGKLPPGRAPRYYRPALVEVQQEGDWRAASALRAETPGPFGICGYRLSSAASGARIVLRSTEAEGFNKVSVDVLAQPGGGTFRLSVDGNRSPPLRTAGSGGVAPLSLDLQQVGHELTIELTGDGPVDLLSWGIERRGRGVLVEGHGINGATVDMLGNMDPQILARDLAHRPPDLILLAFGTNEATDPRLTEEQYAATLTDRVRMLRRLAPGAALMLVGAPDGARRTNGRRGAPCGGYTPLPSLAEVKAAQRRVVQAERLATWDWAEMTGGTCRLNGLASGETPLVGSDRIHFTADGYRIAGERIAAAILPEPRGRRTA